MVEVNMPDYNLEKPADENKLPEIQFTNAEQVMLSQIEDINEKLNKDFQSKQNRNAINIAFFDITNMSGPMQAVYLTGMLAVIFGCIYYFYQLLVEGPEKREAEKKRLREEKKKKKSK